MTMDIALEIRKLSPGHLTQLTAILELNGDWKKLLAIIPCFLKKNVFECSIDKDNPALYSLDYVKIIETYPQKYKRSCSMTLIDDWGCTGRVLPTIGHLLHLLTQAELFRAADYVAQNILKKIPPERPVEGPAAPICTNMNSNILEEVIDDISYPSSLLDNLTLNTFDNNLDHSEKCLPDVPHIIVTPDADELSLSPNFVIQNNMINTNESNEVSSMIKFSESIQSECDNNSETIPVISELLPEEQENVPSSSVSNYSTESDIVMTTNNERCQDIENTIPNFSVLVGESSTLPNLSGLDEKSSAVPNLSGLDEKSSAVPNLSGLDKKSSAVPNLSFFDGVSDDKVLPNFSMLGANANSDQIDFPNLSVSNQESGNISNSKIDSFDNLPDSTVSGSENTEGDISLPNLNVLIPEPPRKNSLNVSSVLDSAKSRQCTSPLPNLTLNTHLPHFAYQELERSTNNFNESSFENLDTEGRFLGSGAFGKVFLATGLFPTAIAVKKILLENSEVVNIDDTVTKQFTNEVEVLSKFKHDNLLSLLGYSCDGCTYCLLYDYIPGGTLKDRLKNTSQKLTWQDRLTIALGTAKAISYLHTAFSSPLIHRDIKSANILLDSSNKPKLGDFGITKLMTSQTTNTTVIGTSAYMAPEALRGDISVKCDTFSFGVVLLELLTSLPVFDENRDGCDLVTHVEDTCEDSIHTLLDVTIGTWICRDINFGDKLYTVTSKCLLEKKKRPVMPDVTKEIEDLLSLLMSNS